MWTIIILIIAGILIKFLYDMNKQKTHVARQGGMQHKYRRLFELIKSGDSRTKIYKDTGDQVTLGISNLGGTTLFIITQTFGCVTIQWKVDSPVFGKHKLEWEFDEYLDQNKMMEKITNDLTHYQINVMTSQGYPNID
jgi:hypothetical protein